MKPEQDTIDSFNEAFHRALGNNITKIRSEMNLTQESFAEQLEIETRYLQKLESGNVSFKTILKFMTKAMSVHINRFIVFDSDEAKREYLATTGVKKAIQDALDKTASSENDNG